MNRNHPVAKEDEDSGLTAELIGWFERAGYVRRYDSQRRANEGQGYKKGFEVRFVLDSEDAVRAVRRLLAAAGFRAGKPFRKHRSIVQPVYGRGAVDWFVNRLPKGRERSKRGFARNGQRLFARIPNQL